MKSDFDGANTMENNSVFMANATTAPTNTVIIMRIKQVRNSSK
jgi:hypothetical protein